MRYIKLFESFDKIYSKEELTDVLKDFCNDNSVLCSVDAWVRQYCEKDNYTREELTDVIKDFCNDNDVLTSVDAWVRENY